MSFRYILLSLRLSDKSYTFLYEGRFNIVQDIDRYIEERELDMGYIARNIEDGITIYTVGKNPDFYVALDIEQVSDYPVLLGNLQK